MCLSVHACIGQEGCVLVSAGASRQQEGGDLVSVDKNHDQSGAVAMLVQTPAQGRHSLCM